jgi:hypothetical protein
MQVQRHRGIAMHRILRGAPDDLHRQNAGEESHVAVRTPEPTRLPQPGWRLIGFTSIGVGTGLYTANVPFVVLAAALVPALIALVVIAAQATAGTPVEETTQPR